MSLTTPQGPRLQAPRRQNDPSVYAELVDRISRLENRQNDIQSAILKSAGLSAEPNLLRVLGSLIVEGNLSVPNGSINNDALANPVAFAGNGANVNAAIPPTSYGTACSTTLTVPSWAGRALVVAFASIGGAAGTGGTVVAACRIDGTSGDADTLNIGANGSEHMVVVAQRTYDPGTTITVDVQWYKQNDIVGASARLIAFAVAGR